MPTRLAYGIKEQNQQKLAGNKTERNKEVLFNSKMYTLILYLSIKIK